MRDDACRMRGHDLLASEEVREIEHRRSQRGRGDRMQKSAKARSGRAALPLKERREGLHDVLVRLRWIIQQQPAEQLQFGGTCARGKPGQQLAAGPRRSAQAAIKWLNCA